MSSGSRQTVLSVAVLGATIAFVVRLAVRSHGQPSGPVHLVVPPPAETPGVPAAPDVLRVCADPNNLPFSDDKGEGFENKLADLVAADLGRHVAYYWQPQRRGFVRTTLNANNCDVIMGVPSTFGMTAVTRPYYRSSYMFVSRRQRRLDVRSLDDPRLRRLSIGIQITGDDYDNPPAAQALASRHIVDNVHGYTVYGDYSQPHPAWGVMDAVRKGDVDVAIAWGPLAGYFAKREGAPLELAPVLPARDGPGVQFAFDVSMGVRHRDRALAQALDGVITRRARDIRRILAVYGVPLSPSEQGVKG